MEIRIERNADASLSPAPLEDFQIICTAHPDFRYVDDVPPGLRQQSRG